LNDKGIHSKRQLNENKNLIESKSPITKSIVTSTSTLDKRSLINFNNFQEQKSEMKLSRIKNIEKRRKLKTIKNFDLE
jgi:hypothetical protein